MKSQKVLNKKAYGSIPHLPQSRMGSGDHKIHNGQAKICLEKTRDSHDLVICQEKLDGSCCAVLKKDSFIIPMIRAGYRAEESRYRQHKEFARWVYKRYNEFDRLLEEGDRCIGEWLYQVHSTRYNIRAEIELFAAFDIIDKHDNRLIYSSFINRFKDRHSRILTVPTIHIGGPLSIENALKIIGRHGRWNALDVVEGAVWRVERENKIDFLAKFVRPDKKDGTYLPDTESSIVSEEIFNWPHFL